MAMLEALSSDVDLSEVWEVVRDEPGPVSLDELAELYWSPSPDVAQRGALLLQLHRDSLYFTTDGEGFTPRSRDQVSELQARQRKGQERSREAASLAEHLAQGQVPAEMTRYQATLLEHLRGYVLHGDSYTKSSLARDVLGRIESDPGDPQRTGFELLAQVGVFSPDEPLEIERAGIPTEFSDDALAEAEAIDPSQVLADPGRADLTALPAITIDEASTQDRDDALSLEMEDPGLGAGEGAAAVYRIGVHIADAGALIPRGGALDREADRRMATLYLPDGRVEMLPSEPLRSFGQLGTQRGSCRPEPAGPGHRVGGGAVLGGGPLGDPQPGGPLLQRGRPGDGRRRPPLAPDAGGIGRCGLGPATKAGGSRRR